MNDLNMHADFIRLIRPGWATGAVEQAIAERLDWKFDRKPHLDAGIAALSAAGSDEQQPGGTTITAFAHLFVAALVSEYADYTQRVTKSLNRSRYEYLIDRFERGGK